MKLWLYTFSWNEGRMVPFFLRHYADPLWERIVVYDNESTDGTPDLLRADPRVEVRTYSTAGRMSDATMMALRNEHWKEARGRADWVYTPDFDEFLWHPAGVAGCLLRALALGLTVLRPFGYEMVSETYPADDSRQLLDVVRRGYPHYWYCKPVVFRPEGVEDMFFSHGGHEAWPHDYWGAAVPVYPLGSLKILHFKRLGWDWWTQRNAQLNRRFIHDERESSMPSHYLDDEDKQRQDFLIMLRDAVDLAL